MVKRIKRRSPKAERRARREEAAAPTRFSHAYAGPDALQVIGPLVWAEWQLPSSLALTLLEQQKPAHRGIAGRLLVDTGASSTCISAEAARELGLPQIDEQETYGAHGRQRNAVYMARLVLRIRSNTGISEFAMESRVSAIPEMEAMFARMGVQTGGNDGGRLIGLLGRDFLRHTVFTYDGPGAVIHLQVDTSSFGAPTPSTQ